MAENSGENKNSKSIGELFVEFGTKGYPTMLKHLNGISASFLLGKDAANQFAQMLAKPMKEAGNTAVQVGKLASTLDTSYKNIQKLQYYFKSKNLSEGLIGDLGKIQADLDLVLSGRGELATGFIDALQQLGLDATSYKANFEDILRLYKDVKEVTSERIANDNMDKIQRGRILRQLGWSEEHGYAWDRGGFNLSDALALPDDVIEKNIKVAENLNEFGAAMKSLTDLLVATLLPPLTKFVNWFAGTTKDIIGGENNINKTAIVDKIDEKITQNAGKIGAGVSVVNPVAGVGIMMAGSEAKRIRSNGGRTGNYIPTQFGAAPLNFGKAPWIKDKGVPTGGAAPIPDFMNNTAATAPSNITNLTQTINITNQNNITGDNSKEIARDISNINTQDIQYIQAQLTNLPGL